MNATEPGDLKQALLQKHLKPTVQRLVILECLRSTRSHPTADEVKSMAEAKLPMISTATVYNVLNQFARVGLAKTIQVGHASSQRFDGDMKHHHHLYNETTRTLIDIPPEAVSIDPKVLKEYQISGVEVILKGVELRKTS